jgi:hypothetical protein
MLSKASEAKIAPSKQTDAARLEIMALSLRWKSRSHPAADPGPAAAAAGTMFTKLLLLAHSIHRNGDPGLDRGAQQ